MLEWNEPMFFNQQNFELYILLIKKEPLFLSHLSVFFLCRIVIFCEKKTENCIGMHKFQFELVLHTKNSYEYKYAPL